MKRKDFSILLISTLLVITTPAIAGTRLDPLKENHKGLDRIFENYFNQGNENYRLGKFESSVIEYSCAIQHNPRHAGAFGARAIAKSALGDTAGALQDYDQAINLNTDDSKAFHNRGMLRLKLRQTQAANADFDRAIQLNPRDAYAYGGRALTRFAVGDIKGAIVANDTALSINPNDLDARNRKSLLQEELNYLNRPAVKPLSNQAHIDSLWAAQADWMGLAGEAASTGDFNSENYCWSRYDQVKNELRRLGAIR